MKSGHGPPIRLDVLGRTALSAGEAEVRALLVQPKRIALLVWLALRRPGGFVRRDEALGTFWPESTEERARASLRQALQFLRRHLGPDALVRRGTDEIGIDTARITCDALAFLDALARGDNDDALARYGGELMPGFHLDGAIEFERWLHGERQRLRALAVDAALRAADRAEQSGDFTAAAGRLAWCQQLEPTDEPVTRRRMSVLQRSGNTAAALAAYDALADRLRRDFDLEPSAATTALYVRIRDDAAGEVAAADATDLSSQRVLVLELANRTGDDRFSVLGSLAAEMIATGLAALPDLVVIPPFATGGSAGGAHAAVSAPDGSGGGAASTPHGRERGAAPTPHGRERGAAPAPHGRERGAASAPHGSGSGTASAPDRSERGTAPAPYGTERGTAPAPHEPAPTFPAAILALARRTGAGTLLDGSLHREGTSLWFRVRATDLTTGRLLPGLEPVQVDENAPLEGIERLRERVVTAIAPALTRRVVHVRPAARPPAIDAYRAYLDGLERFVAGEWTAALEFFGRATALAPEYALPRVVSAIALWNLGDVHGAEHAAREAQARRATLGSFETAVLDMVHAWLAGDWAAAHRAARVQADMAPGSIPHFQIAEESRRLNHPRDTREVLGRLDPEVGELRGWIFYWVELATANHMLRDHARELEVASRCRQLHPHEPMSALLEARALAALGRERDVMRVVDELLASPAGGTTTAGEFMLDVALELRAHGAEAAGAELLDRAVQWQEQKMPRERNAPTSRADDTTGPAAGGRAPADRRAHVANARRDAHAPADLPAHSTDTERDTRASAGRLFARLLYHAGRLDEAATIFEDLARTSRDRVQHVGLHHLHLSAHLDEGYLAAIAARRGDDAAAARWCDRLEDLDGRFLYGAQWYWLAVVAAIRNDSERAVRMLRRAFADGLPMESFVHADPHFVALQGYPQMDALLRPRG